VNQEFDVLQSTTITKILSIFVKDSRRECWLNAIDSSTPAGGSFAGAPPTFLTPWRGTALVVNPTIFLNPTSLAGSPPCRPILATMLQYLGKGGYSVKTCESAAIEDANANIVNVVGVTPMLG